MGRTLDTPYDLVDIGYQCIDSIHFEIPHQWVGGTIQEVQMSKPSIRVDVTWTNYGVDGSVLKRDRRSLRFDQWPAPFITEANDLYTMIEGWLEGQGLILGTGTTETI